jgi:hypothetical protein
MGPLHVAGGHVVEYQRAVFQMTFGQCGLNGGLAFKQPVEGGVKFFLLDLPQSQDRAQAGGRGVR